MRTIQLWNNTYTITLEDTDYKESRWFINDNWNKTSFSWHFNPFEINIKESNYMKTSCLSWDDVRKTCEWTLKMSWVQVFECHNRTYEQSYREIQEFIRNLEIIDMDEFINNKWAWKVIWYQGQLFIVEYSLVEQGCIIANPKDWIRKPFLCEMWDEDDKVEDYELKESIKLPITANIDWFINEKTIKDLWCVQ